MKISIPDFINFIQTRRTETPKLNYWQKILEFIKLFVLHEILVISTSLFLILSKKSILEKVELFWTKNQERLVILSILSFGLIHVTNFPLHSYQYLYAPLLTATQLTMGVVLAYGRLKYGILFSIIIHMLHNTIF